jgi:cytochrome c biogenesis factor
MKTITQTSITNRIERFVSPDNLSHDVVTLVLSYLFIIVAAWNDNLLGLTPGRMTQTAEYVLALMLACEVVLRVIFSRHRPWYFYPLIIVDAVSILTIIPSLIYATFARALRLIFSGVRMVHIIDKLSRARGNPYFVLLIYPFVVPIAAALFFLFERNQAGTHITNFFQSLIVVLSYSLTIGLVSNHPITYGAKLIAGIMLLVGLMCVSIIGNALSNRYTIVRSEEV